MHPGEIDIFYAPLVFLYRGLTKERWTLAFTPPMYMVLLAEIVISGSLPTGLLVRALSATVG